MEPFERSLLVFVRVQLHGSPREQRPTIDETGDLNEAGSGVRYFRS